jgi:predicted DCC family thiol-disulfide oxidoreductase YuxK
METTSEKRILLYDDTCSLCRLLASTIQDLSNKAIETIPLNSDRAEKILYKFYPRGYPHSYYILKKQDGEMRIRRGTIAGIDILRQLGPIKSKHIIKILLKVGGLLLIRRSISPEAKTPCPCPR